MNPPSAVRGNLLQQAKNLHQQFNTFPITLDSSLNQQRTIRNQQRILNSASRYRLDADYYRARPCESSLKHEPPSSSLWKLAGVGVNPTPTVQYFPKTFGHNQ
mmetsp:Transcript_20149/g.43459  ORF Transcript_20149/g.43459 Transcript_20149/m.43459 type:complete len:103 (+) Transcript_20149:1319-1627(+)